MAKEWRKREFNLDNKEGNDDHTIACAINQMRESLTPVILFLISSAVRLILLTTCLEVISILKLLFSSGCGNWLHTSLASDGF
jgi:hypothetical protein